MAWLSAIPRDEYTFPDVWMLYDVNFGHLRRFNKDALWRAWTVLPIVLGAKYGSPDRAKLVSSIAAKPALHWRGGSRLLGESTLRKWVARYADGGLDALTRKPPNNAGQPRVHLSRVWDQAMRAIDAREPQIAEIARKVRGKVRELWRDGRPSRNAVRAAALPFVVELSRAAGLSTPDEELRTLCTVPPCFAEAERPSSLRRHRPLALPPIGAAIPVPAPEQLALMPDMTTPQPAPVIDPDAEWCLLVLRPGAQGGGAVPASLGKWLGRQFKVSSVHFVSAETADHVAGSLRIGRGRAAA